MGKKAKKPAGPASVSEADTQVITSHKQEGTALFAKKDYAKALDSYDKALKLVPEGSSDRALLHSNKAACNMMLKRYKDSVNDCTAALEERPTYFKALCRRAKAYEQLGLYKQALGDVQKANRADESTPETQETERRLRDIVSGKQKPAVPAGRPASGARAAAPGGQGAPAAAKRQPPVILVQAKCTLGEETRLVHMTSAVSYAELLDGVRRKFPGSGPVALKYLDKEGDLVTICDKGDIQKAISELVEANGPHAPKLPTGAGLPPMRITVVKVASEDEVPQPPEDEARLLQQMVLAQKMMQQQRQAAEKAKLDQAKTEEAPPGDVYELDEWLVEFAQLFREQLGIDPDRHVELHNLGYEKCTAALDAAVQSDAALPLFDKAAERFQEVTANGLLNWGNVYMCVARKYIDEAAAKGEPAGSIVKKVEAELAKAEKKYNESLQHKPEYYDSYIALGQLFAERGKVLAGFIFAPPKPAADEEGVDAKAAEAKALEAQLAATAGALEKLSGKDVKKGDGWFDKALAMFAKAFKSLPEEEKKGEEGADKTADKAADKTAAAPEKQVAAADKQQQGEQQQAAAAGQQGDEVSLKAHTLVLWGNLLYEISQVRGAVGGKWKPLLEEAVSKFREAGCSEADIRGALLNHAKKGEVPAELIPEAEPEKPAEEKEEAVAVKPVPEAEPKKGGLAALPVQKKKADA